MRYLTAIFLLLVLSGCSKTLSADEVNKRIEYCSKNGFGYKYEYRGAFQKTVTHVSCVNGEGGLISSEYKD